MTLPPTPDFVERHKAIVDIALHGLPEKHPHKDQVQLDGQQLFEFGVQSILFSLPDLGRECVEEGLLRMRAELSRASEIDVPTVWEPLTDGYRVQLGLDAFEKGLCWQCVGLSRWILENTHDVESFGLAREEYHRYFSENPGEVQDSVALDWICPLLAHAGDAGRCLEYLSAPTKFKPPLKPTNVQAERTMAYVLARHELEGFWSCEDVNQALEVFLSTNVPIFLEGGKWDTLALWIKTAFWKTGQSHPTAEEALFKCYNYLPNPNRPNPPK